jgi:hypothetical protein
MIPCPYCQAGEHIARLVERADPPKPYTAHVRQVSAYALLLAENGVEVTSAQIIYQDMAEQLPIEIDALIPLEEIRSFLETRLAAFLGPELPPILSDPDEVWLCDGYCPVAEVCAHLHGAPIGSAGLRANGGDAASDEL